MFLIGAVLSQKPRNVLELGIGTGYVTASVALALRYNQVGTLTSVDNWFDTRGDEPPLAADLRKQGVNVVCSGEEEFVRQAATDAYDLLISDADHFRSPEWLNEHLRIVKPGGLMFFHDTNSPQEYPALATLEPRIAQLGLPYYHFKQSSRADEHCDRGWLFVMNRKSEDGNA
jgi:predicted O-methyltransferase YrrM